ncbi:MAG: hypothetical protein R3Y56_06920 [Akkermansia sp.]
MKTPSITRLFIASALLLASCSSSNKNPLPLFLAPDSPMDPPGASADRAAEFEKRQKEGSFKLGDTLYVSQGKAYFFAQNPEVDGDKGGKMMDADTVTVLSCEGMYYYVQTPDKDGGYLRESDLISTQAKELMNFDGAAMDGVFFGDPSAAPAVTGGGALFPTTDGLTIEMPLGEDPNARQVLTNAQGRVVTLASKKTEAGDRFEEKKAALPFTNPPAAAPAPTAAPEAPTPAPPANFVPSSASDADIPDLP